jgi:hypothetical protein
MPFTACWTCSSFIEAAARYRLACRMRVAMTTFVLGVFCVAFLPAPAGAVITITPGADTVSTPRLQLDFGDAGADVERVDHVRWVDSVGALGADLAIAGGTGGCDGAFAPEFWGQAGAVTGQPQPVGDGSQGAWNVRGGRSVEVVSFRPTLCTGDSVVTPVSTRYTFFNVGDAASKVRVERRFSFSTDYPAATMRPYVPRLPHTPYSTIVYPDSSGVPQVESTGAGTQPRDLNKGWYAIENPATRAGLLVLRESTTPLARILMEDDGAANTSAIDVVKPAGGWNAGLTEVQWLCFYDQASWPLASRSTTLPAGCSIVTVPISTAAPAIVEAPVVGKALTATNGSWDNAATLSLQWLRCSPACAAIPGATSPTYTPTLADEGRSLRVDVTATAGGGEADVASSGLTPAVAAGVPQNTGLPTITGEARNDEPLFANPGTWGDGPTSFKYQWRRCASVVPESCADVPGATASTYKATKDDVGARMRVRVIGVNALGDSLPADSAPTGEVQPLVVRANLSISPAAPCTGTSVRLDASGSKTPNPPLTRYQLSYKVMPEPALIGIILAAAFGGGPDLDAPIRKYLEGVPSTPLYDGANPVFTTSWSWNRRLTKPELSTGKTGDYVRDPVSVTLTVTDKAGRSATRDLGLIQFAQTYSSQSRKDCPKPIAVTPYSFSLATVTAKTTPKAATVFVPCAIKASCTGSFSLFTAAAKSGRSAAKKPVLLARTKLFTVPAKKTAGVKATWTSAGRALARRKKPFRATLKLTSVNPVTGKASTKSATVTLKP